MSGQAESSPREPRSERRPYEPPQLGRVDLEADQVLAIGCKMIDSGANSGFACIVAACAEVGGS